MGWFCTLMTLGLAFWGLWSWLKNRGNPGPTSLDDWSSGQLEGGRGSTGVSVTMSVGGQRIPMDGSSRVTNAQFVCQGEPIQLHGRSIPAPMLYVTKRANGNLTNAGVIDMSLTVAKRSPATPPELPYWPSYEGMSARHRASYLDWLAAGRKHDVPMGYVFVFFYGLERRLVSGQDRRPIRSELHRLLNIYGSNGSFRSYATRLLTFDALRHLEQLDERGLEEAFPLRIHGYTTDREALSARLSWYAFHKKPLPAGLAFVVAERDPRTTNSVVTDRVRDEAVKLFSKRYAEQYGEGITLRKGRKTVAEYRPASSTLRYEVQALGQEQLLRTTFSDPLSNTNQFSKIAKMLEECIDELRSYSRAVGSDADEEMTPETWEKLPPELKAEIPHPHEERWLGVVRKYLREDGIVAAPAGKIAELCGISERDKLTRSQCRTIASTAAGLGFAIEPDPTILPQSWAWDDTVSLVRVDNAVDGASPRYQIASLIAYLAVYIAGADGSVDDEELEVIRETVRRLFELREQEMRRVEALMAALSDAKITMRGVGDRIDKHLSKGQRQHLADLLVQVAAADGVLDKNEKTYLKRAYDALGLNPDEAIRQAEAMIEDQSPALSEPVSVRQASEGGKGEAIPPRPQSEAPQPEPAPAVKLDAERISQIRRETREVADMLGRALSEATESAPTEPVAESKNEPAPETTNAVQPTGPFAELDDRYRAFVQALLAKPEWQEDELQELARTHHLMLGAAISVVNEWADEYLGEFLIREADPYQIRANLFEQEIPA